MLKSFRIVDEVRRPAANGDELHGFPGSNGGTFVVNPQRGGWVVGNERLFHDLRESDLLRRHPSLAEPLLDQQWQRREYRELNPWTLKIADHCNMACTYCYEDANPQPKRMTLATADRVIDEMLALGQAHYTVLFHGGEPTLNMDVVRHVVRRLGAEAPGRARFIMHTNLKSFPERLQEELESLRIRLGSSLDGIREVNDRQRVNLRSGSVYDAVTRNLARLRGKYLILTITKHNQDRLLESARHFAEDLDVRAFHYLPLLPHGRPNVVSLCPDPELMADGMLEVFDYVLERWSRGEPVKFRNLDDIITALHSGQYVDACQSCALGSFTAQSITVNHDGTFGPCDVSAGMDEHRLGNVHECRGDLRERMADAKSFRVFKRLDDVEGCSTCAFKLTCAGGCEEESMRIGREKNHYCAYYYRVFAAVAVHLQELERIGYVSHVLGDGRRYEHASLAS